MEWSETTRCSSTVETVSAVNRILVCCSKRSGEKGGMGIRSLLF